MRTFIKVSFLAVLFCFLAAGSQTNSYAMPLGGTIVNGSGTIQQNDTNSMVVNQTTNQLITNWNSFNIGSTETVTFNQPSVDSIALNRITGVEPSLILGNLNSNGQVFLSNPSGIIFGQGSRVDVGGLLATTLDISDQDFLNKNYHFYQNGDAPLSSIINSGNITASNGGYVGMLAPVVENRGFISANLGSVALSSGEEAIMNFNDDGLINFSLIGSVEGDVVNADGNIIEDRILNSGKIQANGGQVVLSAKDAGNIIRNVVNNSGIIEAQTVMEKEGRIFLMGGEKGIVSNSGTLDASGKNIGEQGGTVQVTGEYVGLFGESTIDVSGNAGGGSVNVGGGFQGNNEDIPNAFRTYVSDESEIFADATANGNGGTVIVWADDTTRFYGTISAEGGSSSGNGGFAEVSGKNNLDYAGNVSTLAIHGETGTLLLDPRNIIIDYGGTTTISEANNFLTAGETLTIDPATINSSQSNVVIFANNDITVSLAIQMTTDGASLSLFAGGDLMVNAPIHTTNGDITLVANASGHTDQYEDDGVGNVIFGTSTPITVNAGTGSILMTAEESIDTSHITISPVPTIFIWEDLDSDDVGVIIPTFLNDFINLPRDTTQQHVC